MVLDSRESALANLALYLSFSSGTATVNRKGVAMAMVVMVVMELYFTLLRRSAV